MMNGLKMGLCSVGQVSQEQMHFDVIIVGAGISGIGAAYHLKTMSPDRTFQILEGRANFGGTWDLFRYPGVRSDKRHAHSRLPI